VENFPYINIKGNAMILKKIYDEKTKTQKVWYDSTMLLYSEMVENDEENCGNLFMTFKNGTTYVYKNVRFEDYILLLSGGSDASQGKTLNKVIKSNYEYEKLGNADVAKIKAELNKTEEKEVDISNTYFISGHRDITEQEFELNYKPELDYIVQENKDAKFVVGDYYGADIMAQDYLLDALCIDPDRVTVYHMLEAPRNKNEKVVNLVGGFKSDDERDEAMTNASTYDVAYVRDIKKNSGTAQNILRRHMLKTF
jgi:hypothetical protein